MGSALADRDTRGRRERPETSLNPSRHGRAGTMAASAMTRFHVLVSGKVQGVWFRESTRREAERLGVGGWVRNLPDGRVEAVFTGPADAVQGLVAWCHRGPPAAEVERVEAVPQAGGPEPAFRVLR